MPLQGLLLCKLTPRGTGPLQDPALSPALDEAYPQSMQGQHPGLVSPAPPPANSWKEQAKRHCLVQMLCWSSVSSVPGSPKRRPLLLSSALAPRGVSASLGACREVQKWGASLHTPW